jgi:putative Holliday junction resolvase
MKLLGIDYGTKRIGLAISDETLTLARELKIIAPEKIFTELEKLIAVEEITGIVLGHPLNMSGEVTKKTEEVLEFKLQLESRLGLPVYLTDERLSSVMAENLPGGSHDVDSLAAQIILQNYLDKTKTN